MPVKRVVITGMGAISPFGAGVQTMMEALAAGKSAVVNLRERWEPLVHDFACWIGAPLGQDLDPKSIPRKFRKTMGRTALFAAAAAQEAVAHAGLDETVLASGRAGVSFGSTTGSAESTDMYFRELTDSRQVRNLPSTIFFQIMSHTSAANVAHIFSMRGRVISTNSACSSAAQAIGLGYEAIRYGHQDLMLCGGSDELTVLVNASFDLVQAASSRYNDEPKKSPRPFDRDRDGTVCGEGAGCIVLESEESALRRGAPILGEIMGFHTCASGAHLAEPDTKSIIDSMEFAMQASGILPENIDYINAHATATAAGDACEAQAIGHVFPGKRVPVSSLKGYFGHTLGASGALELIAALTMAQGGRLLPTLNLENIDPECAMIRHVLEPETHTVRLFMKNSFAFGGISTVLIVRSDMHES